MIFFTIVLKLNSRELVHRSVRGYFRITMNADKNNDSKRNAKNFKLIRVHSSKIVHFNSFFLIIITYFFLLQRNETFNEHLQLFHSYDNAIARYTF